MTDLYSKTTFNCSRLITQYYSTSFTLGIKTLHKKFHMPIYGIYGFVRFADEIVDSFHGFSKATLFQKFKSDTYDAIYNKISLNPVLHSFQLVVNKYGIENELIEAFLKSMEMDLDYDTYNQTLYEEYIYGSAEVVGLMCLRVFCEGDQEKYKQLKAPAQKLGAAFQKVNFLRDIKSDFTERGRVYFPGVDFTSFKQSDKIRIEKNIHDDFKVALTGILQLPKGSRAGVYLAYIYYLCLFRKIKNLPPSKILNERVRIPDFQKILLLSKTLFLNRLNHLR